MKTIIYVYLSFTLLTPSLLPQERDSLIQLYNGMGDTIDIIDREIFELYQGINGYKYAQLFLRDKNFLVSKITYSKNGILSDTVLTEDISKFSELNYKLGLFGIENEKKIESPVNASVFTNAGNKYDGKLEMFSKRHLFLFSDLNYLSENSSPFKFKTPVSRVDSLMISVKPNVLPYVGYGALVGFGIGLIAGVATFDDDWGLPKETKWLISGAIGAGIGLLLGWLIGETLPPDILTVKFNSPYDVTKLRGHSAYYFQQNKSFEEKYVELE